MDEEDEDQMDSRQVPRPAPDSARKLLGENSQDPEMG